MDDLSTLLSRFTSALPTEQAFTEPALSNLLNMCAENIQNCVAQQSISNEVIKQLAGIIHALELYKEHISEFNRAEGSWQVTVTSSEMNAIRSFIFEDANLDIQLSIALTLNNEFISGFWSSKSDENAIQIAIKEENGQPNLIFTNGLQQLTHRIDRIDLSFGYKPNHLTEYEDHTPDNALNIQSMISSLAEIALPVGSLLNMGQSLPQPNKVLDGAISLDTASTYTPQVDQKTVGVSKPKFCPQCGQAIQLTTKFCGKCGYKLQ
jgi:ribosomal protein S27AE